MEIICLLPVVKKKIIQAQTAIIESQDSLDVSILGKKSE